MEVKHLVYALSNLGLIVLWGAVFYSLNLKLLPRSLSPLL